MMNNFFSLLRVLAGGIPGQWWSDSQRRWGKWWDWKGELSDVGDLLLRLYTCLHAVNATQTATDLPLYPNYVSSRLRDESSFKSLVVATEVNGVVYTDNVDKTIRRRNWMFFEQKLDSITFAKFRIHTSKFENKKQSDRLIRKAIVWPNTNRTVLTQKCRATTINISYGRRTPWSVTE